MNREFRPFTKFCCTIGNIPASYLMSMSYEEQLLWLGDYLQNNIVPNLNKNSEAITEIQEYLDNIDLTEEVDQKLDEMVEDGTLLNLITPAISEVLQPAINGNINNRFAIIPFAITPTLNTSTSELTGSTNVNYPIGFNSNNCLVISVGIKSNSNDSLGYSYCDYGIVSDSGSSELVANATIGKCVILGLSNITVNIKAVNVSPGISVTYSGHIILLKKSNGNEATLLGDVNLDGDFTSTDSTLISRFMTGLEGLNFNSYANADMNKDGRITATDLSIWNAEHPQE